MVSASKAVLRGLLVSTCLSTKDHSELVLNYVTLLIRYLSNHEPGSFDCWFYEPAKQTWKDSTLDAIVTSKRLSLIPKRILNSEGKVEVYRSPGILALFVDGDHFDPMQQFPSSCFDRGMKIIVLYSCDNMVGLKTSLMILRAMHLFNVVCICTNYLVLQNTEVFQTRTHIRTGAVPFQEVFIDITNNLTGRTIHLSISEQITWNISNGYPDEIFAGVIQRLGGRAQFHVVDCEMTISVNDCILRTFIYNSTTTYDFGVNTFGNTKINNENYMHYVVHVTLRLLHQQDKNCLHLMCLCYHSKWNCGYFC